jgi:hypothetical protein
MDSEYNRLVPDYTEYRNRKIEWGEGAEQGSARSEVREE